MTTSNAQIRQCRYCGHETTDPIEKCRKCGGELLTEERIRSGGSLNYAMGTILAIMMGAVIVGLIVLVLISEPPKPGSVRPVDPVQRDLAFFAGFVFSGGLFAAGWFIRSAGRRQEATLKLEPRDTTIFIAIIVASIAAGTVLLALAE